MSAFSLHVTNTARRSLTFGKQPVSGSKAMGFNLHLYYNAECHHFRVEIVSVKKFVEEHWRDDWFLNLVRRVGSPGATIHSIMTKVNELEKTGTKGIGYWDDLVALRTSLRALDLIRDAQQRGRVVDARAAGEAFGNTFLAVAKFLEDAPAGLSFYATAMQKFGENFAAIADLSTGNTKYYNNGYSRRQVRNALDHASTKTTGDLNN